MSAKPEMGCERGQAVAKYLYASQTRCLRMFCITATGVRSSDACNWGVWVARTPLPPPISVTMSVMI